MSGTQHGRQEGVPLRFPRPVMALIATGTAAISIGLSAMPAFADQVRHQEWWLSSLHITAAWGASQGSGVTVAVLSDGVNASAADLAGAVTAAPAPAGGPVAASQYAGEQGTPIASLIAGRGHGPAGDAGVVGVAPKARILSVPVTLPADDPQLAKSSVAAAIPSSIAAGIRYAVKHGASVIDLPIDPGQAGSNGTGGAPAAAGGSAAERSAISYALAHNVVLVAPAGDNAAASGAPNYPAAYRGIIAVGAFDSAFNKAPWSSRQSYVTLTAAGAGVVAAANAGGYQTMNSTSAASAIVSGAVALVRSRYPGLTGAEVRQALVTSTSYRRAGGAGGSGYGAVNASQALTAAATMATPPGHRAGAGAQPREAPATVPAPASSQSIGAQILRAAEISGALLVFLLLVIGGYEVLSRRRWRSQQPVAAEWMHRHGQSRYPQAGSADVERMLELFAAPAVPPAPTAPPASPAPRRQLYASRPADNRGADGVFAPSASREPHGLPARQAGWPAAAEPAASGASDAGGWVSLGPATRAVQRRPSVSGAPPWEPAAAPDGELPWAAAPRAHEGDPRANVAARPAPASDEPGRGAAGVVRPGGLPASHPDPSGYAPGPGYDPIGGASHFDREPTSGEYSSSAGAIPPGGYRTPTGSAVPAGPPPPASYRSPTGSGAPGRFDLGRSGASGYGYHDAPVGALDAGSEFDAPPPVAPSGLPMRQPQATRPPGSAPLSPSGSLWEPASRDANSPGGLADQDDQR